MHDDSGWRRVGFTGQGCEKLGTPTEVTSVSETAPGGWERAGYDTAACERFARA